MLTADCALAAVTPTLFAKEFSLADRVALVSGANRGIGLEMAMALAEAGARAVYCVDLPRQPGEAWVRVQSYLARMEGKAGEGRLEYISADVRDQVRTRAALTSWVHGADNRGSCACRSLYGRLGRPSARARAAWTRAWRLRGCCRQTSIASSIPRSSFRTCGDVKAWVVCCALKSRWQITSVNVDGVLFTAQAAGRQMARFGNGGSIVLIASMSGSISNQVHRVSVEGVG